MSRFCHCYNHEDEIADWMTNDFEGNDEAWRAYREEVWLAYMDEMREEVDTGLETEQSLQNERLYDWNAICGRGTTEQRETQEAYEAQEQQEPTEEPEPNYEGCSTYQGPCWNEAEEAERWTLFQLQWEEQKRRQEQEHNEAEKQAAQDAEYDAVRLQMFYDEEEEWQEQEDLLAEMAEAQRLSNIDDEIDGFMLVRQYEQCLRDEAAAGEW